MELCRKCIALSQKIRFQVCKYKQIQILSKPEAFRNLHTNQRRFTVIENVDIAGDPIPPYPGLKKRHPSYNTARLWPWHDQISFERYMISNIIYNDDGLVAINKPYGLFLGSRDMPDGKLHPYNLYQAVPAICQALNVDELHLVSSIDIAWFQSGVVLFAVNKKLTKVIRECMKNSPSLQILPLKYWCITVGVPSSPTFSDWMTLIMCEDIPGPLTLPIFVNKPDDINKLQKILLNHCTLAHSSVGSGEARTDVGLVEVGTGLFANKFHLPLVYLSHRASCILGDRYFSTRVKSILGRRVTIDPRACRPSPQILPISLSHTLKLQGHNLAHLPVHQHLHQVNVVVTHKHRRLLNRKKAITITAPPPSYFTWTMKQLKLDPIDETLPSVSL